MLWVLGVSKNVSIFCFFEPTLGLSLNSNYYTEKAHKWVSTILDAIYLTPLHDTFRRYPGLLKLGFWMTPKSLMDKKQMINDYSKEVVARYEF